MRKDRFFVNFRLKKGQVIIENAQLFHRIRNVLRKRVGEEIILFDGSKKEGICKIVGLSQNKLLGEILEIKENEREPEVFVTLYCSILKKRNFELVVQKATEIGIKKIVPIICGNTIKLGLNLERLRKISIQAAEQSGRGILPEILEPKDFNEAIKEARDSDLKILFDLSGKDFSELKNFSAKNISIFIGPEGGWKNAELEVAKKENFEILNLGKLILKGETAAIVASFLIVNQFK